VFNVHFSEIDILKNEGNSSGLKSLRKLDLLLFTALTASYTCSFLWQSSRKEHV